MDQHIVMEEGLKVDLLGFHQSIEVTLVKKLVLEERLQMKMRTLDLHHMLIQNLLESHLKKVPYLTTLKD